MQIPLFNYIPEPSRTITLDEDVFTQWKDYLKSNFNAQEPSNLKEPTLKALNYNLEQIKEPLNNAELEVWSRVITQSKIWFRIGTFVGSYLRYFYEKSDKTNQIGLMAKLLLHKCSRTDKLDFLSAIKDDYSIFEQFYTKYYNGLKDLFLLAKDELNNGVLERNRFNYLAKYVYSPRFVEDDLKYMVKEFVQATDSLSMSLNVLLSETFNTKREQLTFLVSTLYIVDRAINEQNDDTHAPVIRNRLVSFFRDTFPEEYKQYKVMRDLNVKIAISELITQLCVQEKYSGLEPDKFKLPDLL